jgi:uncharacterized protein YsxB (DUF464 family)
MIIIKRSKDGFDIVGHANYAPQETDIVCAGVSTLVQTLIQSMEELTEDRIEYDMKPGEVHIKFWSLSSESRTLIDSFFIGVSAIAETYPFHVRID